MRQEEEEEKEDGKRVVRLGRTVWTRRLDMLVSGCYTWTGGGEESYAASVVGGRGI